jgi:hypothetical protein
MCIVLKSGEEVPFGWFWLLYLWYKFYAVLMQQTLIETDFYSMTGPFVGRQIEIQKQNDKVFFLVAGTYWYNQFSLVLLFSCLT